MFSYLDRYKEGKRLQKPFADVITKAALSSQLFKDPVGPAEIRTRDLPLSRSALTNWANQALAKIEQPYQQALGNFYVG